MADRRDEGRLRRRGRDLSGEDEPVFAPVFLEDDGIRRPPRGPGEEDHDAGLLRVLGLIVVLGLVIVALVLPGSPVSLLGRGGGGGGSDEIRTIARGELPPIPEGFVALSRLFDIEIREPLEGPWSLTVPLVERTSDGRNVAFYRFEGGRWQRIGGAQLVDGGRAALGEVEVIPPNIAVLRRGAVAHALALSVPAGMAPDPAAVGSARVVAVGGGTVTLAAEGGGATVRLDRAALDAARAAAGSRPLYLRVSAPTGDAADAVGRILGSSALMQTHVADLVEAAEAARAGGLQLDYRLVDPARRAAFTTLVTMLSQQLAAKRLALAVSVPTMPTAESGAYDWPALTRAGALWVYGPDDRSVFYEQVEAALAARRAEGVDLASVMLVVDRASRERTRQGVSSLSLRDALATASELRSDPESGIVPGQGVTLTGVNLDRGAGNSGLVWDDAARSVAFSYADRLGPHTVWIENRFSVGFRLDLADRFGLGGVVVTSAQRDDAFADVWRSVLAFVDEGAVELRRPYGPYLLPCWRTSDGVVEGYAGGCWKAGLSDRGTATWRAPQRAGVYDVTLLVSDGTIFVGRQLAVRVASPGEPEARPTRTPTPAATPRPTA
ncbi:MAG: hypothetical protein FJZ92_09860, partial [Chloroflexi bacterium]|nr:hypothetical protein [Chloroflexota bacterium]